MAEWRAGGPGLSALLHLCDSLFPTGGYAHSDGLEAATDSGAVATADDLRGWLDTLLSHSIARTDGPAIVLAWEAARDRQWPALRALDDELHALRPSSTARTSSRGVGSRLLKTWMQIYPSPVVGDVLARADVWTLPVAFAVAALSAGADARTALESYAYTRLAATTSAAMRLMRLGQLEAHTRLAESLAAIPRVADAVLLQHDRPAAFTPLADIATMRQQYVTTRLFRS